MPKKKKPSIIKDNQGNTYYANRAAKRGARKMGLRGVIVQKEELKPEAFKIGETISKEQLKP